MDFFVHRVCHELESLAAALGGLDALVPNDENWIIADHAFALVQPKEASV